MTMGCLGHIICVRLNSENTANVEQKITVLALGDCRRCGRICIARDSDVGG